MAIHHLSSIDDPRLAAYRDLPRSKSARASGRLVVEGWLLVERLLASSLTTESVVVDREQVGRLPVATIDCPVFTVESSALRELVGFRFHRGVLACGQRPSFASVASWLPAAPAPALIVVCVDVRDPANVGGIIRCAAGFGADGVVLNRACADPFSRRALRASMGSAITLPVSIVEDTAGCLGLLRDELAVELVGTTLAAESTPLDEAGRGHRTAVLFGEEGEGLAKSTLEQCDHRVTIPMQRNTDSLNVTVACGICLYHFAQRPPS